MNKILVALVVILIGIQSWTLKTQQQILNKVMPEVKLDTTISSEYCSYIKDASVFYLKMAKRDQENINKFARERNIEMVIKRQDVMELNLTEVNKLANSYQAFCKD